MDPRDRRDFAVSVSLWYEQSKLCGIVLQVLLSLDVDEMIPVPEHEGSAQRSTMKMDFKEDGWW